METYQNREPTFNDTYTPLGVKSNAQFDPLENATGICVCHYSFFSSFLPLHNRPYS